MRYRGKEGIGKEVIGKEAIGEEGLVGVFNVFICERL
jgi:hypothetical protein